MTGDARPILVTGGAGFIGSNLADRLAGAGHDVLVFDSLARPGVEANLRWLEASHGRRIERIVADVRDGSRLATAARRAKAVFHFAAQVAVTTSLVSPRDDFDINVGSTFALLEAMRLDAPETPLVFASTNKVYGDLEDLDFVLQDQAYVPCDATIAAYGIDEDRPLDFHTPYGCSKGAADQYVLDYARSFGLRACVLRMSCIYGRRQMGTEDQGWVAHFLIRALEGRQITLFGDGCQVRDILDVSDAVDAYVAAWERIDAVKGRAFNLGGGPDNAISLRALLDHLAGLVGHGLDLRHEPSRAGDQKYFVADTRVAQRALGLGRRIPWREGLPKLLAWLAEARGLAAPAYAESEAAE